ncbi:MAG: hypothetical protein ABIF82_01745 [Planctomycetota bacterium]
MKPRDGFKIVLAADRTLTADYAILLDAMLACSQTTAAPLALIKALMLPKARVSGVRAKVAPLGLRRIEAALAEGGFGADEVAVVEQGRLREAIGPATRIVGVATGEPTGRGMNTTTMTAIAGGEGVPAAMFDDLMRAVRRAIRHCRPRPAVVVGGPGAWQLAGDRDSAGRLGIDHVVTGYAEGNVADLFRSIARGDDLPDATTGEAVGAAHIPRILGASAMGVVEISRGCGLGCPFCTIARTPMQHLPEDTILADAKTNVASGNANICAISEDLFRYGADGSRTRPEALISLLSRLRQIGGVGIIQTDHANIVSVEQYTGEQLGRVRRLMVGGSGQRHPWVNLGIETASAALLKANGCGPKMGPHTGDEWPGFCADQLRRLCRAGFLPMASIVIGLPGETADDTLRTLAWVESLAGERITIFPELYAPIDGGPPVAAGDLSKLHWRLIRACYKFNFKWVPRMYWDGQRAAGVGLPRRCLIQALGCGQTLLWKALLARHSRRSRDVPAD